MFYPKTRIKKILIILSFLILGLINNAAALDFPFLNKTKIRLSIAPGQTKYDEIIIENPTALEKTMRVYSGDWYYLPGGDGSKEFAPADSKPFSCASWITFSPAEFAVPAFGRQRVSYSVKVPLKAEGGYYAVLFFETQFDEPGRSKEGVGAGIKLAVRTAALFYVEAAGTVKRTADLENLTLSNDKAANALLIKADFRNTGNVDITCGGSYHIMDKEGNIYARGELNNVYTFPKDTAIISASWKDPIPKGKYDLVLTLDLGKALEEAGLSRGPIQVKESEIEIGDNGEVVAFGRPK